MTPFWWVIRAPDPKLFDPVFGVRFFMFFAHFVNSSWMFGPVNLLNGCFRTNAKHSFRPVLPLKPTFCFQRRREFAEMLYKRKGSTVFSPEKKSCTQRNCSTNVFPIFRKASCSCVIALPSHFETPFFFMNEKWVPCDFPTSKIFRFVQKRYISVTLCSSDGLKDLERKSTGFANRSVWEGWGGTILTLFRLRTSKHT